MFQIKRIILKNGAFTGSQTNYDLKNKDSERYLSRCVVCRENKIKQVLTKCKKFNQDEWRTVLSD